jgi:hypothetical protein
MARYVVVEDGPDERAKASFDRTRWTNDRVSELADGFTLRPRGREGSLYYKEDGNILELGFELAGDKDRSILISRTGLKRWIKPGQDPLSLEDQQRLEALAVEWLRNMGLSGKFLSPETDLVRDW